MRAKIIREFVDFKRGQTPAKSLQIGIAKKIKIFKENLDELGYRYEEKGDKIRVKGLKTGFESDDNILVTNLISGIEDILHPETKWKIGSVRFAKKYSYLMNQAVDEGYIPPDSFLKSEIWSLWEPGTVYLSYYKQGEWEGLTDENLLKILSVRYGSHLPPYILNTLGQQGSVKTPYSGASPIGKPFLRILPKLKQLFHNKEFYITKPLRDLSDAKIIAGMETAVEDVLYPSNMFYDIEIKKRGIIKLQSNQGSYNITKYGRVSIPGQSTSLYTYNYTNFSIMAEFLIDQLKKSQI